MPNAIHYPIWIKTPESMDITLNEFYHLSWNGIASFLISWPFAIEEKEDGSFKVIGHQSKLWRFVELFNDLEIYISENVSMLTFQIPKNHQLINKLNKYCSHLKFKK